jgi:hypothetical protein
LVFAVLEIVEFLLQTSWLCHLDGWLRALGVSILVDVEAVSDGLIFGILEGRGDGLDSGCVLLVGERPLLLLLELVPDVVELDESPLALVLVKQVLDQLFRVS